MQKILLLASLLIITSLLTVDSQQAFAVHPTFATGDVFAGKASGTFRWHHPDGSFRADLTCPASPGGFTTGMAFDAAGKLYGTMFSNNAVCVWDTSGTPLGTFGGGYSTPESIVFDAAGNVYVGGVGGNILKFNSAGVLLQTSVITRVDWMDLAADQCTMFYGTEGDDIKRFDVCTNSALADFVPGGMTQTFAMRILPNGDLLVADNIDIKRFNSAGVLQQNYNLVAPISGWFALNLDPDGTSFWSGSFNNDNFYKFDIASGAVLAGPYNVGGGNTLFGLAVFGEPTVGGPGGQVIGGEILPVNNIALMLAGLQVSSIWMAPLLAGSAGAAVLYLKMRKN